MIHHYITVQHCSTTSEPPLNHHTYSRPIHPVQFLQAAEADKTIRGVVFQSTLKKPLDVSMSRAPFFGAKHKAPLGFTYL